jgi:hypothetical protein
VDSTGLVLDPRTNHALMSLLADDSPDTDRRSSGHEHAGVHAERGPLGGRQVASVADDGLECAEFGRAPVGVVAGDEAATDAALMRPWV